VGSRIPGQEVPVVVGDGEGWV